MTGDATPLFALDRVRKTRTSGQGRFSLEVPDLIIRRGTIVLVRGPSGCGKSSLLDILAMTLEPDDGEEFAFAPGLDNPAIAILPLWRGRRHDHLASLRAWHIGYVLQTGGLLPFLTVRDNIELPCRLTGRINGGYVHGLVERLGIGHLMGRKPADLSVGERQRVAIARALAHNPTVVIADEPMASLDPVNAEIVFTILIELVRQAGCTAIIASHDPLRVGSDHPGGGPVTILDHQLTRDGDVTRSVFRTQAS